MEQTTFKWSNYFKATPANLQYLTVALKTILVTIAASAYVSGNEKIAFWTLISGAVLDELAKFFHKVNEEAMKTVSLTFPKSMESEVEITTNTTKPNEDGPVKTHDI